MDAATDASMDAATDASMDASTDAGDAAAPVVTVVSAFASVDGGPAYESDAGTLNIDGWSGWLPGYNGGSAADGTNFYFSSAIGNTSAGGSGPGSLELIYPFTSTNDGANLYTFNLPAVSSWTGYTITAYLYVEAATATITATVGFSSSAKGTPVTLTVGDGGASSWQPVSWTVPSGVNAPSQIAIYLNAAAAPGSATIYIDDVQIASP